MGGNRAFFEETSLVATPAVSMRDCKERLHVRLKHHGIVVEEEEEEEFCYIPMGGGLPTRGQRILAMGGAASLSHPSTGYTVNRMLASSCNLAEAIVGLIGDEDFDATKAAAVCYDAVWSRDAIMERNFAVFGGDFLMKQNVVGLRGFFSGFFALPIEMWSGFLSHYPNLPNNDKHANWYVARSHLNTRRGNRTAYSNAALRARLVAPFGSPPLGPPGQPHGTLELHALR